MSMRNMYRCLRLQHNVSEGVALDEIIRCVRGADDDVGINEKVEFLIYCERRSVKFLGNSEGASVGAVCDDDVRDPV